MTQLKCVVVGDTNKSRPKTALLLSYTTNSFPGEYIPEVSDNYSAHVMLGDKEVHLQLWDTTGQEDYPKLRPISYPMTDVFVLTFSLVSPKSLENVQKLWLPEIKEHCPNVPYVLAGLDLDLRDQFAEHTDEYKEQGMEPVSHEQGEEVKNAIGAYAYVECSSRLQLNLKDVFESAIKAVLPEAEGKATPARKRQKEPKKSEKKVMKCVVVGDGGPTNPKTTLLLSYKHGGLPDIGYVPTVFDNILMATTVDNQEVVLQLWDTAGQEDMESLRVVAYINTAVFVLVFSLVSPESLENIKKLWIPEIRDYCPDVPYILVGTDLELRDQFAQHADEYKEQGMEPVSHKQGEEVKNAIGAYAYVECSSKLHLNVKDVFDSAVMSVLSGFKPPDVGVKNMSVCVFGMPKVGKSLLLAKIASKIDKRAGTEVTKKRSNILVTAWKRNITLIKEGKKRFGDSLGSVIGKDIIICVYDTTDATSFAWICKKIKKLSEKSTASSIIVVGTKKDCANSKSVSADDVKQLGDVKHFEVSAENDDLDELFSYLNNKLFDE